MSIEEFAELINEPGYSETILQRYNKVYRKLYKETSLDSKGLEAIPLDKQDIISRIEDEKNQ